MGCVEGGRVTGHVEGESHGVCRGRESHGVCRGRESHVACRGRESRGV